MSWLGSSVAYTNYTLVNNRTLEEIIGENARGYLKNLGIKASEEAQKKVNKGRATF